jgi:hypothetical protein
MAEPHEAPEFNYPAAAAGSALGVFIIDTVAGLITGHDALGWVTHTGPENYQLGFVAVRDIAFGALTGLVEYGMYRHKRQRN